LITPAPSVVEIYRQVGRRHGSGVSPHEVAERFRSALSRRDALDRQVGWTTSPAQERTAWRSIVEEVFHDVPQAVDVIFETLWEHFARPTSWQVEPDVVPLWHALRRMGLRIGLASNFDERLHPIARQLDPLADADVVFDSAQLGARKPGRKFFTEIQRQLKLTADELMLVGDDLAADYQGARAAGWQAVWYDRKQAGELVPGRIVTLVQLLECL
jgi:putative hydrolase of the HAD superfamily